MKHITRKIITLLVVFTFVIIGIFIIQFKSGKNFSVTFGAVFVTGRYNINEGENVPLLPVQITANGISFFVSEKDSIIATDKYKTYNLKITKYTSTEKSFTIHCTYNAEITFSYDKLGDIEVLTVSALVPENFSTLSLPWKITGNARFEIQNNKSLIVYNKKNFEFDGNFGFNDIGIVDTKIEQPRLTFSKLEYTATYKNHIQTNAFDIKLVSDMQGSSESDYNNAKDKFSTQALSILSEQINKNNYNEKVVVAYISEMARRNMYLTALENVPARVLPKKDRSELSLPFYGNIIELYENILQKENNQRQNLSKLISEKSTSIFDFENVIAFLVDHNSTILISDLPTILDVADLSKLTLSQAIGIIESYLDYTEYFGESENFLEKNLITCFREITNSFFVLDGNLYSKQIIDDKSFIDTSLTLRLVRLLLRLENQQNWKNVAYKLYTSVCDLIGIDGSLVKTYNVETENGKQVLLVNDEYVFSASEVYPMLIENNWYPSAKSLHMAKKGCWVYGAFKNINIQKSTSNYLKFTVEGIKGGSEYLILRNIHNLKNIVIYGLDYKSDPRFETYNSAGYVYNKATATLYLKLKHKKDVEEIVLQLEN